MQLKSQEYESLPPLVSGSKNGILNVRFRRIKFQDGKVPAGFKIKFSWWGQRTGPVIVPVIWKNGVNGNDVTFPIRCDENVLVQYLSDMNRLTVDILDSKSLIVGRCVIPLNQFLKNALGTLIQDDFVIKSVRGPNNKPIGNLSFELKCEVFNKYMASPEFVQSSPNSPERISNRNENRSIPLNRDSKIPRGELQNSFVRNEAVAHTDSSNNYALWPQFKGISNDIQTSMGQTLDSGVLLPRGDVTKLNSENEGLFSAVILDQSDNQSAKNIPINRDESLWNVDKPSGKERNQNVKAGTSGPRPPDNTRLTLIHQKTRKRRPSSQLSRSNEARFVPSSIIPFETVRSSLRAQQRNCDLTYVEANAEALETMDETRTQPSHDDQSVATASIVESAMTAPPSELGSILRRAEALLGQVQGCVQAKSRGVSGLLGSASTTLALEAEYPLRQLRESRLLEDVYPESSNREEDQSSPFESGRTPAARVLDLPEFGTISHQIHAHSRFRGSNHLDDYEWLLRGVPEAVDDDDGHGLPATDIDDAVSRLLKEGGPPPSQLQFPSLHHNTQNIMQKLLSVKALRVTMQNLRVHSNKYGVRRSGAFLLIHPPAGTVAAYTGDVLNGSLIHGIGKSQRVDLRPFLRQPQEYLYSTKATSRSVSPALNTSSAEKNLLKDYFVGAVDMDVSLTWTIHLTDAIVSQWTSGFGDGMLRLELFSYLQPPVQQSMKKKTTLADTTALKAKTLKKSPVNVSSKNTAPQLFGFAEISLGGLLSAPNLDAMISGIISCDRTTNEAIKLRQASSPSSRIAITANTPLQDAPSSLGSFRARISLLESPEDLLGDSSSLVQTTSTATAPVPADRALSMPSRSERVLDSAMAYVPYQPASTTVKPHAENTNTVHHLAVHNSDTKLVSLHDEFGEIPSYAGSGSVGLETPVDFWGLCLFSIDDIQVGALGKKLDISLDHEASHDCDVVLCVSYRVADIDGKRRQESIQSAQIGLRDVGKTTSTSLLSSNVFKIVDHAHWKPPVFEVWANVCQHNESIPWKQSLLGLARWDGLYDNGKEVKLTIMDPVDGEQRAALHCCLFMHEDRIILERIMHSKMDTYISSINRHRWKNQDNNEIKQSSSLPYHNKPLTSVNEPVNDLYSSLESQIMSEDSLHIEEERSTVAHDTNNVEHSRSYLIYDVQASQERMVSALEQEKQEEEASVEDGFLQDSLDPWPGSRQILSRLYDESHSTHREEESSSPPSDFRDDQDRNISPELPVDEILRSSYSGSRDFLLDISLKDTCGLALNNQLGSIGAFVCYTFPKVGASYTPFISQVGTGNLSPCPDFGSSYLWWDSSCAVLNSVNRYQISSDFLAASSEEAEDYDKVEEESVMFTVILSDADGGFPMGVSSGIEKNSLYIMGRASLGILTLREFITQRAAGINELSLPIEFSPQCLEQKSVVSKLLLVLEHRQCPLLLSRPSNQESDSRILGNKPEELESIPFEENLVHGDDAHDHALRDLNEIKFQPETEFKSLDLVYDATPYVSDLSLRGHHQEPFETNIQSGNESSNAFLHIRFLGLRGLEVPNVINAQIVVAACVRGISYAEQGSAGFEVEVNQDLQSAKVLSIFPMEHLLKENQIDLNGSVFLNQSFSCAVPSAIRGKEALPVSLRDHVVVVSFYIRPPWRNFHSLNGEHSHDNAIIELGDQQFATVTIELTPFVNGFPVIEGWYHLKDSVQCCQGQLKVHVEIDREKFIPRAISSISPSYLSNYEEFLSHANMNNYDHLKYEDDGGGGVELGILESVLVKLREVGQVNSNNVYADSELKRSIDDDDDDGNNIVSDDVRGSITRLQDLIKGLDLVRSNLLYAESSSKEEMKESIAHSTSDSVPEARDIPNDSRPSYSKNIENVIEDAPFPVSGLRLDEAGFGKDFDSYDDQQELFLSLQPSLGSLSSDEYSSQSPPILDKYNDGNDDSEDYHKDDNPASFFNLKEPTSTHFNAEFDEDLEFFFDKPSWTKEEGFLPRSQSPFRDDSMSTDVSKNDIWAGHNVSESIRGDKEDVNYSVDLEEQFERNVAIEGDDPVSHQPPEIVIINSTSHEDSHLVVHHESDSTEISLVAQYVETEAHSIDAATERCDPSGEKTAQMEIPNDNSVGIGIDATDVVHAFTSLRIDGVDPEYATCEIINEDSDSNAQIHRNEDTRPASPHNDFDTTNVTQSTDLTSSEDMNSLVEDSHSFAPHVVHDVSPRDSDSIGELQPESVGDHGSHHLVNETTLTVSNNDIEKMVTEFTMGDESRHELELIPTGCDIPDSSSDDDGVNTVQTSTSDAAAQCDLIATTDRSELDRDTTGANAVVEDPILEPPDSTHTEIYSQPHIYHDNNMVNISCMAGESPSPIPLLFPTSVSPPKPKTMITIPPSKLIEDEINRLLHNGLNVRDSNKSKRMANIIHGKSMKLKAASGSHSRFIEVETDRISQIMFKKLAIPPTYDKK